MEGNQQKTDENEARPRNPAIRTMRSDVQELFKATKPSLLELVGQEVKEPTERLGFKPQKGAGKITLALAALALVGGVVAAYFFLFRSTEEPVIPRAAVPQPFFAVESARTVTVESGNRNQLLRLVADTVREPERRGHIKRVLIKLLDGPQERFADINDFFAYYRIPAPKNLLGRLSTPLMTFIYYGSEGTRFGLALPTASPERTFADMLSWEQTLALDLKPLFFGEVQNAVFPFEDRTYRNIDWRFLKLSQDKDFGIAYTVFPAKNLLVITTGKEAIETVINRLFDVR